MKKRLKRYLRKKEEDEYTNLDKLYKNYLETDLMLPFTEKGFKDFSIYPRLWKGNHSLQVQLTYFNLKVGVDFFDEYIEFCVYLPGDPVEVVDRSFIKTEYGNNFNLIQFIDFLIDHLNKNSQLSKKNI